MAAPTIKRLRPKAKGEILAALDVGSSKIVCLIARVEEQGGLRLIGVGHQVSRGLRSGTVVDMHQAEGAIAAAVQAAEDMAGTGQLRAVLVNLSTGAPASQTVGIKVPVHGHPVSDIDLARLQQTHARRPVTPGTQIVHVIPVTYAIDGNRGVRDPRGMFGEELGAELHVITAHSGPIRNLSTCIDRCHLAVDRWVMSAYAAGLAVADDDERDLGCTVIDIGGGTTGTAVFVEDRCVFTDHVPVGGQHITHDIAHGLTTSLASAERLKTLTGSCLTSSADDHDTLHVPQVGEEDRGLTTPIARSLLTGIIRPRVEEILELVRGRIDASGFSSIAGRRVVLTGGGAQLEGIREIAQAVLDKQVRVGRPRSPGGVVDLADQPAFTVALGLLRHATRDASELELPGVLDSDTAGSLWSRLGLGGWFRAAS